jgi:hypothetical protein
MHKNDVFCTFLTFIEALNAVLEPGSGGDADKKKARSAKALLAEIFTTEEKTGNPGLYEAQSLSGKECEATQAADQKEG